MGNKYIIRMIAAIVILAIPAYNLCKLLVTNNILVTKAKVDCSAIEEFEKADIAEIQKKIDKIRPVSASLSGSSGGNSHSSYDPEGPNDILKKIQSGETSYAKLFKDTLIAGDSLVEALELYNLIDGDNVMGKVSASLYELEGISGKIISYRPKTLILHYGENHVGGDTQVYVDNYIEFYTKLVKNFKEKLPDTRIVISSIFVPNSKGLANSPYLKGVPRFNEGLRKMCDELDVVFLDNTPLFSDDAPFYEPDGVHVKRVFYTDYWLPYMAYELNLA